MKTLILPLLIFMSFGAFSAERFCSSQGGYSFLEKNPEGGVILHLKKNDVKYRLVSGAYPTGIIEGERYLELVNYPSVKQMLSGDKLVSGTGYSFFGTSRTVNARLKVMTYLSHKSQRIMVITSDESLIFAGSNKLCR
jgi:hypothetical protein